MTTRIGQRRLKKEIQMYEKENFKFPNLILRADEADMLKWFFIVYDLKETPFEGGVYFGKILLPEEYPLKPPDFIFMTPNGRFETDKKICTSFSGFHRDTYTSAWNIMTMMEGMISFMTDLSPEATGIASIETSEKDKQELAKNSLEWNKSNEQFLRIFEDVDKILE